MEPSQSESHELPNQPLMTDSKAPPIQPMLRAEIIEMQRQQDAIHGEMRYAQAIEDVAQRCYKQIENTLANSLIEIRRVMSFDNVYFSGNDYDEKFFERQDDRARHQIGIRAAQRLNALLEEGGFDWIATIGPGVTHPFWKLRISKRPPALSHYPPSYPRRSPFMENIMIILSRAVHCFGCI